MNVPFLYPDIFSYLCCVTIPAEHLIIRELETWRSYGIGGKGPTEDTLIKDIGDEHLLKIIQHLQSLRAERDGFLPVDCGMMYDEIAWRMHDCWQSI